jgi:galactokinase
MYGIAECRRAKICGDLLEDGKIEEFSKLMNISHDGDRVSKDGNAYDSSYPDSKMDRLISENAPLEYQPGGYACSTPEIDRLVDIARKCDGVKGVQLSGAGLGGCIMILVEETEADSMIETLINEYYKGDGSGISICKPVKGSGVINFSNTHGKRN